MGIHELMTVTFIGLFVGSLLAATEASATLPDGVRAVWDIERAHRVTTDTRERVSINGLW
ncbi:MAG: hypothetical protein O3A46_05595 [Candidatus Poribacteria bacterium]|nr:hypothetical protein [Candidatus Poribacteria bacterium]